MSATDGQGITKMPTGIEGFDEITGGGLPRGRTTLLLGEPGTGKTVFSLQNLVNGFQRWGEPGIFVAFEENTSAILANAHSFGWGLARLRDNGIFFLDARLPPDVIVAGAFDLNGLLATIGVKAREMGAKRVVFDAVDVLLHLMQDPIAERQELSRIEAWLRESGLTGIITLGVSQFAESGSASLLRYVTFMSDCVVQLQQRVVDRVSLRTLRVVKYRGSAFAENEFPMVIGPSGIDVASFGITSADLDYPVYTDRVSTGVEQLDAMIGGGYLRGSSVLITGAPGTAKSTLSGAFLLAAAKRGERALYVSFDESADEIVRNLASVSIQMRPYIESGLLRVQSARAMAQSAEEHLINLRAAIVEHRPQCVVVDPLSAMLKAGGALPALTVAQRLLHVTKADGITLLTTSLIESGEPLAEQTALNISTVADTWLHVSYVAQGGERNRALTVVKSRGTSHSNQVRELILSDEGVALADVYTAGGEVLMGTLRWEREQEITLQQQRQEAEFRRRQAEMEAMEAEATARIEALRRELAAARAGLEALEDERRVARHQRDARLSGTRSRRSPGASADEGAMGRDAGVTHEDQEPRGGL